VMEVGPPGSLCREWFQTDVSCCGEKVHEMCQVRVEKANASESLMKCRKRSDVIETGVQLLPRDEPRGYLLTNLAVAGTKVARARQAPV
jgi:hypothetical protein